MDQKLLAEKKKMNNVPVSTALTAILEKYSEIQAKTPKPQNPLAMNYESSSNKPMC